MSASSLTSNAGKSPKWNKANTKKPSKKKDQAGPETLFVVPVVFVTSRVVVVVVVVSKSSLVANYLAGIGRAIAEVDDGARMSFAGSCESGRPK